MKVIDLLNKAASGEEVPNKIRIDHWCYKFEWVEHLDIYYDKSADIDLMSALSMSKEELNYGVEILEEPKEELEEIELLDDNSVNYNFSKIQNGMTKEDRRLLDSNFKTIGIKINKLIANQNKIIRELKDNKENE